MTSAQRFAPSSDPVRVLLVEDSQDDHRLICDLLDAVTGVRFVIDWARDLETGRDHLDHRRFDIGLIDHRLPDGNGLELVKTSIMRGYPAPMIVLTGHGSNELDQRALRLGAYAFLDKNRLDPMLLERTIRYSIRQHAALRDIARASLRDDATGLITPTLFQDRMARALALADRQRSWVAMIMIDLNIAADEGSDPGQREERLAMLAKALVRHLRKTDTVARLADQQLGVIIEGLSHPESAALVARKVLDRLTSTTECQHKILSPRIGIALYPEDCGDIDSLLRQAESAMRRAGTEGGHGYRFGNEHVDQKVGQKGRRRFLLAKDLRLALDRKAMTLRYLPSLHVANAAISLSAEIYADASDKEPLSRDQFLSIADDRSLIEAATDWMVQSAVAQLVVWQQQGIGMVDLALPLVSMRASDLPLLERSIRRHVGKVPTPPNSIEIDLGQDLVIDDLENGGLGLAALKRTGVRLALDDFGREGAVFHKLNSDLLDSLKLSSRLYRDLPGDASEETLLKAIINLGHDLDLRVVANGARDEQQFAFLKLAGCDAIKLNGAHSSLTAASVVRWLQDKRRKKATEAPKIVIRSDTARSDVTRPHPAIDAGAGAPTQSLEQQ